MTTTTVACPPLESGDHLTREEFHRRYLLHPDIKKAELIDGVVYVGSPVSARHSRPDNAVNGWLFAYVALHPALVALTNTTVILPKGDHEVQPDALLMRLPPLGNARITEDDYIEGAPELVVEIAASSASRDLHNKLRAYESAGVLEYIVWQTHEARIDWFVLREGRYAALQPNAEGVIESATFAGLRLPVPSMLAGDAAGVLATLRGPGRKRRGR